MTDQGDHTRTTAAAAGEPAHPQAVPGSVDEAVMGLLHEHVPLTLLVDLVDAPPSEQVLVEEGIPEQRWWEGADHPAPRAPEAAPDLPDEG